MSTRIGLVQCGLKHLENLDKKEEFCVGLIRGFGSTLNIETKKLFAKNVRQSSSSSLSSVVRKGMIQNLTF